MTYCPNKSKAITAMSTSSHTGNTTQWSSPNCIASIQTKTPTANRPITRFMSAENEKKTRLIPSCFHLLYECLNKGIPASRSQQKNRHPKTQVSFSKVVICSKKCTKCILYMMIITKYSLFRHKKHQINKGLIFTISRSPWKWNHISDIGHPR